MNAPETKTPIHDDETMTISDEEKEWALEIKRAVEDNEHLLPLTDYEYVQHALVSEGKLGEALCRVERMQNFCQEYGVDKSVEQAMEMLVELIHQQPGFLLHMDCDPVAHNTINVIDLGMFDPRLAQADPDGRDRNWRTFACGVFYMKYCSQPSFATIRAGFYVLAEFGDVGNHNSDPAARMRLFDELMRYFPMKWKQFLAFNTGYAATIMLSIVKSFMPKTLASVVEMGCQIEESDETRNPTKRLREFYMQPTVELAYKSILQKARAMAERRDYNTRHYRLEE